MENKSDIFCIQETKAHPDQVNIGLLDYKYKYWNSAQKKGYSGTAIFSKIKPVEVARTTAKEVFVRSGITEGALVVTSAVPNPYNGMKVRLPGDEPVLADTAEADISDSSEKVESERSEGEN